jgi:hypothetical protein
MLFKEPFMHNFFTKTPIFLCLLAFNILPVTAHSDHGINLWDSNQTRPFSDDCLPPELQNLPYAVYPNDPNYNTDRLNFNKRFNYFPQAIITPTTPEEAQFVLRVIKQYDLEFSMRSGRHCFEPGSLSSNIIFDLSRFNSIIPDIANQQVYIGAGARLVDVINTLGELNYAIPTGTCPSVGVAGLTMGGGASGFLQRTFGLTCQVVKSITFLNAEAQIIEVTESNYPDLFWALLGAGNGSYGIALGFTFQMFYVPEVTYYELSWEWDPKLINPIMEKWQKWVKTLPDTISSVLGFRHPNIICAVPEQTPPLVIRVFGIKVGSEPFTEWEKAFSDLDPEVFTFTGRYVDTRQFWDNEPDLPFNKLKSRILMKLVTKKVMKQVTRFFTELEVKNPDFLVYFNFEAFGGKIRENHTSFFPSKAFAWWEQSYYWDRPQQTSGILALSRRFYKHIPKEVSKYCYANIVDYDLGPCYLKLYYGNHVNRLIEIKKKYDPTNLFHWKQSIPTSKKKLYLGILKECPT